MDQVAFIPLQPTFDGAIGGFESNGGGAIDEGSEIHDTRNGIEIVCADVRMEPDTPVTVSTGSICGWKGRRIGFVIVIRLADAEHSIDAAARIAKVLDVS